MLQSNLSSLFWRRTHVSFFNAGFERTRSWSANLRILMPAARIICTTQSGPRSCFTSSVRFILPDFLQCYQPSAITRTTGSDLKRTNLHWIQLSWLLMASINVVQFFLLPVSRSDETRPSLANQVLRVERNENLMVQMSECATSVRAFSSSMFTSAPSFSPAQKSSAR